MRAAAADGVVLDDPIRPMVRPAFAARGAVGHPGAVEADERDETLGVGRGDGERAHVSAGRRVRRWIAIVASTTLALGVVAGSVWFHDDQFPFAPFRMFSYGNDPNGLVRSMRFEVTYASGRTGPLDATAIGLRRAELEGQTHPNRRVPDAAMAALVEAYNARHDDRIVHLQVVVRRVDLVDSVPQPGVDLTVIGDYALDEYQGPRVVVDLPPDTSGRWEP